jgi:hypothetical protein
MPACKVIALAQAPVTPQAGESNMALQFPLTFC